MRLWDSQIDKDSKLLIGGIAILLAVSALAVGLSCFRLLILLMAAVLLSGLLMLSPRLILATYLLSVPFFSFVPVGTHQFWLFVAASLALAGQTVVRRSLMPVPRHVDWCSKLVWWFLCFNLFALFQGAFRSISNITDLKFIVTVFASFAISVGTYFLVRHACEKRLLTPDQVVNLFLLGIAVNLILFLWFFGTRGWTPIAALEIGVDASSLRSVLFGVKGVMDLPLAEKLALLPGVTNGKAILFLVGLALTAPMLISNSRVLTKLVNAFLFAGFLAGALLTVSRTALFGIVVVMIFLLWCIFRLRLRRHIGILVLMSSFIAVPLLLSYGALFDLYILGHFRDGLVGFLDVQNRIVRNLSVLNFLDGFGVLFGKGFGFVELEIVNWNPHNIFSYMLANGGIFLAFFQLFLFIILLRRSYWLLRSSDTRDSLMGMQAFLVGLILLITGMLFTYTKWPQIYTIFWAMLGLVSSTGRGPERASHQRKNLEGTNNATLTWKEGGD